MRPNYITTNYQQMDNSQNRMIRTPSSSSARSPSYGSDGQIYQNNQVGKSVDSLVGIPQMGLQDPTSPATTIRQGLSVQELKAMTARRMATSEMITSPKSGGLTSSYGTANPEQLQKAQIGLEIAAPQNRPLQTGRDREQPYANYSNPIGSAPHSLYSVDAATVRPPFQKFNTQPNFQHRGGYQPDQQPQPQFQQQQQHSARDMYLGGGGAMQRTVGIPQYTAAGAAGESPFYNNRLLRSNTEGVGEQAQNKLRLPNAASAIISGGQNPSRRADGVLISSHTRQLMDGNFSPNGRLNAHASSVPIENSLASLEIFGDSAGEGGGGTASAAAYRGSSGGLGGGSVSLPLLAGPGLGDGGGGGPFRSSLLGQTRFGADEEAAGREIFFAHASAPRIISGSGAGAGAGSVLSAPQGRRQPQSQSEASALHDAAHGDHPPYMLGRQASQSRLHDPSPSPSLSGFAHPQMSRQMSTPHPLQSTDVHLLQRSYSADRNFDLTGGGGGGGGGGEYLLAAARHSRLVRQESAMQPWLEEAEAEDQMYSPRDSSSKERGRDRDRDRGRDREDDRGQGQGQFLGLGLGLSGSSATRSDGERRLDPLARPPLQPPPGLQPQHPAHSHSQPNHPNAAGMAKASSRSSSRLPVPGLLAPLDGDRHSAALTYPQKVKRGPSSFTPNNLSEDDSDDRSLPEFFDYSADSNANPNPNPNYFPHAANTSTSPLSFFVGGGSGGRLTAAQRAAAVASFHRDTPDSQAAESDDDNSILLRALGQHSISYGSELSGAGSAQQPFYQHNPHPNHHHQQQQPNPNSQQSQHSQQQQLFGRAAAGELEGPAGLSWSGSRLMSGAYGSPDHGQGQGQGQGLRRLSQYPHTDELE